MEDIILFSESAESNVKFRAEIDPYAPVNFISQRIVNELGVPYGLYDKSQESDIKRKDDVFCGTVTLRWRKALAQKSSSASFLVINSNERFLTLRKNEFSTAAP